MSDFQNLPSAKRLRRTTIDEGRPERTCTNVSASGETGVGVLPPG